MTGKLDLASTERLDAVASTGLLQCGPLFSFDRMARLAAQMLGARVALVSLIDGDHQIYYGQVGLPEPLATPARVPIDATLCHHVVTTKQPVAIDNVRHSSLAGPTQLATKTSAIAYLGCPIRFDGQVVGTFCVTDDKPRHWTAGEIASLGDFAELAMTEIKLRAEQKESANRHAIAEDMRLRLDAALEAGAICSWVLEIPSNRVFADANLARLFGVTPEVAAGGMLDVFIEAIHPEDRPEVIAEIKRTIEQCGKFASDYRVLAGDGEYHWIEARGKIIPDAAGRPALFPGVIVDITPRKLAEDRRRQDEEFQRLIFESVKDFSIFTTDLDGIITTWNQGAENVFGYQESEAIGQPAALIFTPEDRIAGIPEQEMRSAAATGRGTDERWHLKKDGSRFFASGMVTPLRDATGDLIGFTKVARDVTEHKLAEERLRTSEEKYRTLFDSMDEGFCVIEMLFDEAGEPFDWRYLEMNPAFEGHTGLKNAAGLTTREAAPGMDPHWIQLYGSVARTGEPIRYINEAKVLDERWFEVYAFRLGKPEEHLVAVLFNDISERKRNDEAIVARAGQLQKLAEIASRINDARDVNSVIWLVTEEVRKLIGAHHAATTMVPNPTHPQPVNAIAHSLDRRLKPNHPDINGLQVYQAMQTGNETIRLTSGELDADARWQTLGKFIAGDSTLNGWLATPLIDHSGQIMGLIQLSDKSTGQFTGDDESILIQMSRIASIAVENARLYEELRDNDRRKDEFLAMLAHELRNPLGAISSGMQLVQQTQKPEMLSQLRGMIQDQVKHLTRLIDDLLDVSRITQGKIALQKKTVELSEIVRRATGLAKQQIEEKHHKLTIKLPAEPVHFVADATRVEQILNNLLTNAAKYSDEARAILLWASVDTGQIVIRVIDEGFGIAPEMLPRVFGLFTQVDATIDRARGGLGIGLTLVKSLVEMHGGGVEAKSEGKGKGSEFIVRLPIGQPQPAQADVDPKQPIPSTGTGRVLVVDDNLQTARLTARMLKNAGFTVETAYDGLEGVDLAREFEPEIILLDLGLPGLNGYEVAQTLRGDSCCKDSLLIAISGYGEEKARERSKTSGFNHHLTKPLDFEQLMSIIGKDVA